MRLVCFFTIFALGFPTWGQQQRNEEKNIGTSYDFSLGATTGPLLPDQIENVTEIQPSWNGLLTIQNLKGDGAYEFGILHTHEKGVTLINLHFSLRKDVPLADFTAFANIGADFNRYDVEGFERQDSFGGHAGFGVFARVAGDMRFRSEMRFLLNPGVALYIGFGFELLFGTEEE